MQFRQLEVFCVVAELGNFTKAAEALYLTQPGVTFHIRTLEKQIGTKLFVREGHKMVLTEAGKTLHPYALKALEDLRLGFLEVQKLLNSSQKTIHMGAGTNLAISYLLPALGNFLTHVGSIKVELVTGISEEIMMGVEEDELDIGLIWGPVNRSDLYSETIATEKWVLVSPADPRLEFSSLTTARGRARLSQLPFVLPAPGATRIFVESMLAKNDIKPRVVMELKSAKLIVEAILNGKGVGLTPQKTSEPFVTRGILKKYELRHEAIRPIVMIYKKSTLEMKPYLSEVMSYLSSVLKSFLGAPASSVRSRPIEHTK